MNSLATHPGDADYRPAGRRWPARTSDILFCRRLTTSMIDVECGRLSYYVVVYGSDTLAHKRKGKKSKGKKKRQSDMLSIREAAVYSGVVYETVSRWVRSEELKATMKRVQGKRKEWRIRRKDLEAYLDG